jgi:hypothetical protein
MDYEPIVNMERGNYRFSCIKSELGHNLFEVCYFDEEDFLLGGDNFEVIVPTLEEVVSRLNEWMLNPECWHKEGKYDICDCR